MSEVIVLECKFCKDAGSYEFGGYIISCRACEKGYNTETERLKMMIKYYEKLARDLTEVVKQR